MNEVRLEKTIELNWHNFEQALEEAGVIGGGEAIEKVEVIPQEAVILTVVS